MKKISQIILYAVLGVLVIGFVLTAILKKDFSPNIMVPTYAAGGIEIKEAGLAKYDGLSNEENYNKFVSEYKASFELTILYSVFSGKISREQEVVKYGTNAPSLDNGYIITFVYPEAQTLKVNGDVYLESVNSDTETLYKKVIFAVEDGKGLSTEQSIFIQMLIKHIIN